MYTPRTTHAVFATMSLLAVALVMGIAPKAQATTLTWTGSAGAAWDTSATNWSGDTTGGTPWTLTAGHGDSDIAYFNTAGATPLVSGTVYANGLTFDQTATISGGTITLAGTAPAITANADATIGSVLAGTAGLTKNGPGTLTLTNNANTYSGGTVISNGTIGATGINRLTTDTNKDLTFGDAGTTGGAVLQVNMNGNFTLGTVTTASNAAASNILNIATSGGSTLAMTNAVIGTGAPLTLRLSGGGLEDTTFNQVSGAAISGGAGAGADSLIIDLASGQTLRSSLTLNTANTFTGNVLIQGTGTWQMQNMAYAGGSPQNLWIPDASSVTVQTGATWSVTWGDETIDGINGGGNVSVNGSTGAHTLTVGGGNGNGSFSGALSGGNTSFAKTGSGTQILSGTNTYSGTTAISGGTLQIGNGGSTGTLGAGAVTNNATLVFNRSDTGLSVANAIGGSGAVTQNGTGTTTLSGTNSYTGMTTVSNGTLVLTGLTNNSNNANVGAGAANGQLATSAVSVASGATFILNTGGSFSSANTGTTLSGEGTLRLASGTWWLGNSGGGATIAMSAGGVIDVQGGGTTLKNDYSNANWAGNQGSLNIGTGANFNLRNNNVTVDALTGSGAIFNDFSTNTLTIGVSNTVNNAAYGISGNTATFSGTIGAGGTSMHLTKIGSGTQRLSGTNTYTGATTANNGTLSVTGGSISATSQVIVGNAGSAAAFDISGGAVTATTNSFNALLIGNAAASPGTLTVSGGSFTASGAGSGAVIGNNAAGTLTQTGGTISIGNGGVFVGNLVGATGSSASFSAGSFTTTGVYYNGVRAASTTTVSGTGNMSVGTFNFGNGSGVAAASTLNLTGGTLTSANGMVYGLGTHTVNLDGGTLRAGSNAFAWANNANVTATIGASGVTLDSQAFTASTAQVLGGAGGITKIGSGTWTLSGANTYAGGTTVNAGTLLVNHATGLGASTNTTTLAGATLTIGSGVAGTVTQATVATSGSAANTIVLNAGGALGANANALLTTLNLAGTGALTIQATNTGGHSTVQDFEGQITGSGVATGTTALILDGTTYGLRYTVAAGGAGALANTFTGDVIIKGAVNTQNRSFTSNTAAYQNKGFLNNNVTVQSGTWSLVWGGETVQRLDGSGNIVLNNINALNNIGLTVGNNDATGGSYGGSISGGFGVAKTGTGTQTLTGANTYTGDTTVSAGTLEIAGTGSLGSGGTYAGDITLGADATFLYSSSATQTLSGTITAGGAAGTSSTLSYTGGGTLNLTGGLVKDGTTLIVTGNTSSRIVDSGGITGASANSDFMVDGVVFEETGTSDYNGPTTVKNNGTLLANASITTTAVTVNTGGTLGGNGTLHVAGAVSIANDGFITGGEVGMINTLNIDGTTTGTFDLAGTYLFDVNYGSQTGDLISITDALSVDLNSGGTGKFKLNTTGAPAAGSSYYIKIFESNVEAAGYGPGQSNYLGQVEGLASYQSIVTWDGGKTFYLVPEPASFMLLGLGSLLLLRRPTRRRGRAGKILNSM